MNDQRASAISDHGKLVRPRVASRLTAAMSYKVTILIAPAGFGKTTAIQQVTAINSDALLLRTPYRATLHRFVSAFANCCSSRFRDMSVLPEELPSTPDRDDVTVGVYVDWAIAHLANAEILFAIEDLQNADGDPRITRFVTRLIDQTKATVRWIISSRSRGTLPLTHWQAYGDSDAPITAKTLRFSTDEAVQLATAENSPATLDQIERWVEQTHGFPVPLTYAIRLSARRRTCDGITDDTRILTFDYLAEQLWPTLSVDDRALLETIAFLPALSIDHLRFAGVGDARLMLFRLLEDIVFVNLSRDGEVSMHDLFRDFVREQVRKTGIHALESRIQAAVTVLVGGHLYEDAVRLLLEFGAIDELTTFIETFGETISDHDVLEQIVQAVDRRNIASFGLGMLSLQSDYWGWHGNVHQALLFAAEIIKRKDARSRDILLAIRQGYRAINGQAEMAQRKWLSDSGQLLSRLSNEDRIQADSYRASILARFSDTRDEARALLEQLGTKLHEMNTHGRLHAELLAAGALYYLSDRESAIRFSRAAISTAASFGNLREKARAQNGLGLMFYSARDREIETLFKPLREAVRQTGSWRFSQVSHWIPAEYYALKAEVAEFARALDLQKEIHLTDDNERSRFDSFRRHCENLGNILNKSYHDVINAHLKFGNVAESDLRYNLLIDAAVAYALLDSPSESDAAIREARYVYDRLSAHEAEEVKECVLFEVACLGANGRWHEARRRIEQISSENSSLILAERALRKFCEGPPFTEVDQLLNLCANQPFMGLFGVVLKRLVERSSCDSNLTLTSAELDVLRQMSSGKSNKEIAASRRRSPETVKRQVASLFKKLGVENRVAALKAANRRGLI